MPHIQMLAKNTSHRMKDALINHWNKFVDDQKKKHEPLSADNWFLKAAVACEATSDAVSYTHLRAHET